MSTWREYAVDEAYRRFNGGERLDDVLEDVVSKYEQQMITQAKIDIGKKLERLMLQRALDPECNVQLSFEFNGETFKIPDTPVIVAKAGGGVTTIPALHSTADERQASFAITLDRLMKKVRRTERAQAMDRQLSARMVLAGLDPNERFSVTQHLIYGTTCARCGGLPSSEDPFELGHFDAPASQGGRVLAWEHRNCNRGEHKNDVAPPLSDDDRS